VEQTVCLLPRMRDRLPVGGRRTARGVADCQSAIQQTSSLRYNVTARQRFMDSMRDLLLRGIPVLVAATLLLAAAASAAAAADVRRDATVEAVQRVMPAVVNIRTETIVERHDPFERLLQEFWGPYYSRRGPETTYSLGSGVIIDEEGWVLTNFHVVNRATKVFVRTADGREFEAERIVGTSLTDVALLRMSNPKREKFATIKFAGDDDLLLGETVIALGNPYGLGGSVSRGILSSKSRRPPLENEPLEVEDWLQTDAAINPGNSGGPLVNLRGELIGVNVAVYREGQGIGFAIPVRRVSTALGEMYSPEVLQSLWFGARVRPGSSPLTISSVQPESPAGKAGLRAGDQIVEANGKVPKGFLGFVGELLNAGTTNTVPLIVQRGAERKPARLRLVRESTFFNSELVRKKIGITVDELTPQAARALELGDRHGVIITEVDRDSPAARAGLQKNMIITTVDGQVTWSDRQPAPAYVPVAKALYAKAKGDKSQFEVIIPRRIGRYLDLQQAKVEVTVR
jgi:serine protease Do